jgi:FemAB-related protein (PEP-CTERM system-associated)
MPSVSEAVSTSARPRKGAALLIDEYSADGNQWNEAVGRLGGSLYHLWQWRTINARALGHRSIGLVAKRDETMIGLLPLVYVESRLFGRILCSMPFVNYGGACASDSSTREALVQAATDKACELRCDYLEVRSTQALDLGLPVSLHKVSMTIPLAPDPDTLWKGFTHKHRKNVRRAYKNGLTVVSGGIERLPEFYRVMEQSWRNLGTPLYSRQYFADVLDGLPEHLRVFVCHHRRAPVAAALTGYFNGVVEGLWAGGVAAARDLDANYVLYWEMIRDACARGCDSFHLGRSTAQSGGEEFKSRWNAHAQQLYWYYFMPTGRPAPALNVTNPKFRLAIRAWRHMPLWCTRCVGPLLARSIP